MPEFLILAGLFAALFLLIVVMIIQFHHLPSQYPRRGGHNETEKANSKTVTSLADTLEKEAAKETPQDKSARLVKEHTDQIKTEMARLESERVAKGGPTF